MNEIPIHVAGLDEAVLLLFGTGELDRRPLVRDPMLARVSATLENRVGSGMAQVHTVKTGVTAKWNKKLNGAPLIQTNFVNVEIKLD